MAFRQCQVEPFPAAPAAKTATKISCWPSGNLRAPLASPQKGVPHADTSQHWHRRESKKKGQSVRKRTGLFFVFVVTHRHLARPVAAPRDRWDSGPPWGQHPIAPARPQAYSRAMNLRESFQIRSEEHT